MVPECQLISFRIGILTSKTTILSQEVFKLAPVPVQGALVITGSPSSHLLAYTREQQGAPFLSPLPWNVATVVSVAVFLVAVCKDVNEG